MLNFLPGLCSLFDSLLNIRVQLAGVGVSLLLVFERGNRFELGVNSPNGVHIELAWVNANHFARFDDREMDGRCFGGPAGVGAIPCFAADDVAS